MRYRVAQTRQSRKGRWPTNANWIMNNQHLTNMGSSMWQGVMKSWNTIQSGIEQQDPTSWAEIMRQPLFGNRLLTNEVGIQWGTESRSSLRRLAEKGFQQLKDIVSGNGQGWRTFQELNRLCRSRITTNLYDRLVASIPWEATPMPPYTSGQWVSFPDDDGHFRLVYHLHNTNPIEASVYRRENTEQLVLIGSKPQIPAGAKEVRVIRTIGASHTTLDFNPTDATPPEQTLWMWGKQWICELEWDPKDWNWRRLGMLPDSSVLNYTTKRGYHIALRQDNNQMVVDAELEAAGYPSKARAKFINRIWHPYLPRKVSAMQWLVLNEGLPVGAWREKVGLSGDCQLCNPAERETLQHAFVDCTEVHQVWDFFRQTRGLTGQPQAYLTWTEISRGLMNEPEGPRVEADLQWDTASAFSINIETPWDILRAQLLWSIWRQRVAHAFKDENFHLGLVLWHAWKNTIYCAMEALKELHRHKRNEEKRQEQIACFQKIWTASNIFGRMQGAEIKWHLTPPKEFLPQALAAWMAPPIRINRLSPSPDLEAEFTAQPDFQARVQEFLDEIGNNLPAADAYEDNSQEAPIPPGDNTQEPLNPLREPNHTPSQTQADPPLASSNEHGNTSPQGLAPETDSAREPLSCLNSQNQTLRSSTEQTRLRGIEKIPPGPSGIHPNPKNQGRSRPKIRCLFGPKTRRSQTSGTQRHASVRNQTDSQEIDDLLREIDIARFESSPLPNLDRVSPGTRITTDRQETRPPEAETYQGERRRHSHSKVKCRFGPYSKRAKEAPQLPLSPQDGPFSPSLPRDSPTAQSAPGSSGDAPQAPAPPSVLIPQWPCRVTLTPPAHTRRTPFHHYFPTAAEAPRPDPNRFRLARLGITAEELDARVDREVEDALLEHRANRRLAALEAGTSDCPRILTKEDCLTLFRATGVPPPGALWGVWRWAADLDHARFNFEREVVDDDYSFLDAYD